MATNSGGVGGAGEVRGPQPDWLPRIAALVFSLYWATMNNLLIEFVQFGNISLTITYALWERLSIFLIGSFFVWLVLILAWASFGKLWVAAAATSSLSALISFANYRKLQVRMEPLYPSDLAFLTETRFLKDMVSLAALLCILAGFLAITLLAYLASRFLRQHLPSLARSVRPKRTRASLLGRLATVLAVTAILSYAGHFNSPGNAVRVVYEAANARWAFWYQKLNYQQNGFVGGLLYNTRSDAMSRPPGYSRHRMQGLAKLYAEAADRRNRNNETGALEDVNIVLILSEAFSDPEELKGLHFEQNPIPFTRDLIGRTPSGRMLAQLYGGGTANMEFEALTGMSLSQFRPQMQTPYQMLLPEQTSFPSFVGYAARNGMGRVAVHPYMTSMYKRETVYPILGFQDFIGLDDMAEPTKLEDSDFVSDAAAFAEVEKQILSRTGPVLINLVTMQNHYPMQDHYEKPIPVAGIEGDYEKEAGGYGRGLRYTDEALRDFIGHLGTLEEPTAVVFYGDHQPGIWPSHIQQRNGDLLMRTTPFFLWANFELKHDPTIAEYTSPIYFLPLLYKAAGAHIPPYFALLLQMYETVPAMSQGLLLDRDGNRIRRGDLSYRARELLRHYRLFQYDLSIGSRFSLEQMFPQARPSTMASD